MLAIKLFIISVILSERVSTAARIQNSQPYLRFKSIKCNSSNKTISGYKCFIKAYSRTNTTINVFVNLTEPHFKADLNYDLTYKSLSNSYRSIINVTYEICSILNGTGSNPVFQWVVGHIPNLREILHVCPYKV
ncbi:hypothetical protein ACKWTF_014342 [Chironomus riparius]